MKELVSDLYKVCEYSHYHESTEDEDVEEAELFKLHVCKFVTRV